MQRKRIEKYLLLFAIGYCVYLAVEVTYRGFSFRLMGIAGGLALAGIGILEDLGMRKFRYPVRMAVSALLITALELYSGFFSLKVLGVRMWDYRDQAFSLCDGLICPLFSLFWFFFSALGICIADWCEDTFRIRQMEKKRV